MTRLRAVQARAIGCWLACCLAAAPATRAAAFDYEQLVALIRDEGLTTMEQVIERLPAEYLENYTLIFDSRSLHGSSYEYPRAILFGRDARLVLSFNGHPDQRKYQNLELIQYREAGSEFEMRSVSFEDGVRFSGKNPELCLSCHGARPHPIWSSYEYSDSEDVQHWPGSYGSTHDAPRLNQREKEAFLRFRDSARDHPRYRFLRLDHPQSRWYPFGVGPYDHRFRPNNRLGNLLARWNARRIAADLTGKAFFRRFPNLTLQWLLTCPGAGAPPNVEFLADAYRRRYPSLPEVDLSASATAERTAFVFEKLLSGPEVYTWNLSLKPGPDDERFFTGIVSIDELVAAAVLARLPSDHWLRGYYVPWSQRELYDTFKAGYYDNNVAPGGVGETYEQAGPFFDRERAREACPRLERQAAVELARVD